MISIDFVPGQYLANAILERASTMELERASTMELILERASTMELVFVWNRTHDKILQDARIKHLILLELSDFTSGNVNQA